MPKIKKYNLFTFNNKHKKHITIRGTRITKQFVHRAIRKIFVSLRVINSSNMKYVAKVHHKRITSSNVFRVLSYPDAKSTHTKLDWFTIKSKHIRLGIAFENSLIDFLQLNYLNIHQHSYLTTHKDYTWLGSTPDAIIKLVDCSNCKELLLKLSPIVFMFRNALNINNYDRQMHEKYLNIMKNLCYNERVVVEFKLLGSHVWKRNFTTDSILKKDKEIYHQLQYEMYLMNTQKACLIYKRRCSTEIVTHIVNFDMDFIKKTLPRIANFYITKRIPFLIHKYFTNSMNRKLFIKQPNNIVEKTTNKPIKKLSKRSKKRIVICNKEDSLYIKDYVTKHFGSYFINNCVVSNDNSLKTLINKSHDFLYQNVNELLEYYSSIHNRDYDFSNAFLSYPYQFNYSRFLIQNKITAYYEKKE